MITFYKVAIDTERNFLISF